MVNQNKYINIININKGINNIIIGSDKIDANRRVENLCIDINIINTNAKVDNPSIEAERVIESNKQ